MAKKRCVFVDRECTPDCMAHIEADGMCGIHAAIEGVELALKLVQRELTRHGKKVYRSRVEAGR